MSDYGIRFRPEVIEDLGRAFEWYESQLSGLGDRFLGEFFDALTFIQSSAETPRKVFEDFRRVLMKRFPFAVWYEVHAGTAVILLVFDCRQDPNKLTRLLQSR